MVTISPVAIELFLIFVAKRFLLPEYLQLHYNCSSQFSIGEPSQRDVEFQFQGIIFNKLVMQEKLDTEVYKHTEAVWWRWKVSKWILL